MSFKSSLPWDLEQAMTAFQVDQNWYEEYWLRDTNDFPDQSASPSSARWLNRHRFLSRACQAQAGSGYETGLLRSTCDAGSTFPAAKPTPMYVGQLATLRGLHSDRRAHRNLVSDQANVGSVKESLARAVKMRLRG